MATETLRIPVGFEHRVGGVYFYGMSEDQAGCRDRLMSEPFRTFDTFRPVLSGSCGSRNNVSLVALGVVRVVSRSGNRTVVERLEGEAEAEALRTLGYPGMGEG